MHFRKQGISLRCENTAEPGPEALRAWAERAVAPFHGVQQAEASGPIKTSFSIWGPVYESLFGPVGRLACRWDGQGRISVLLPDEGIEETDLILENTR